jgi:hypothetical protein
MQVASGCEEAMQRVKRKAIIVETLAARVFVADFERGSADAHCRFESEILEPAGDTFSRPKKDEGKRQRESACVDILTLPWRSTASKQKTTRTSNAHPASLLLAPLRPQSGLLMAACSPEN